MPALRGDDLHDARSKVNGEHTCPDGVHVSDLIYFLASLGTKNVTESYTVKGPSHAKTDPTLYGVAEVDSHHDKSAYIGT